jgi:hypothetical protein
VKLTKESVRAYVDRDWSVFERTPRTQDPARSHALADALYEAVRRANPGWPTAEDRAADLAAHVRATELYAKIHDAQRRRGSR